VDIFFIEIPVYFATCSYTFGSVMVREYYNVLGRGTQQGLSVDSRCET
jgi:hypothetical protein